MSWTTPRTWVAGEIVTAALLNTHVRDNLSALLQTTSTITTTGTQTALALPSGGRGDLVIFANNASLLTIQGIAAGSDGQRLTIYSIGAGVVSFAHQNGSAGATARLINFATSGLTSLAAGVGMASYVYDLTTARWRLEEHEQGAFITAAFAAGDFTGTTQPWTVGSGDVTTSSYYLEGRKLTYRWFLLTTTVTSGATLLNIGNGQWGGFNINKTTIAAALYNDNGAGNAVGFVQATDTATSLAISKLTGTFGAATDNTGTFGEIVFEVS